MALLLWCSRVPRIGARSCGGRSSVRLGRLLENGDLGVIVGKGQPKKRPDPERGTIVIALNVDEDHDEVHYSNVAFRGDVGELVSEAIETLVACRTALTRLRTS
jgi:hypothetical protein